jgi:hypothetical protein
MQSKVPETYLRVQITPDLKAAIEKAADADGQSVDVWVSDLLERAVKRAQELRFDEEEKRKQVDAKKEKALHDMLKRMTGN